MSLQHVKNQDISLVLSSDAKPRLKWTPELHQRFINAVNQLGGADKATPKSLMRVMGIHGLTLYHLKSHLQKYRLGKSQQEQVHGENKQQAHGETQRSHFSGNFGDGTEGHVNGSLPIAQALQMQMEVQRKLHEQIEVQRHLQLRIEAQGKYLRSVLMKAQETLAGYNSYAGMELAKAELSQLVSMVETACPSSSLSILTDTGGSTFKDIEKNASQGIGCSLESSLTSSESWGTKEEEAQPQQEIDDTNNLNANAGVLSLMEMHPGQIGWLKNRDNERKRSRNTISDNICVKQHSVKRSMAPTRQSGDQARKFKSPVTLDLNIECLKEFDSAKKAVDLNQGS